MSSETVTNDTEILQTWLSAVKDTLNRASSSDATMGMAARHDFVRSQLSRHAAAINKHNKFAALPSAVLYRILSFTSLESCIYVAQTCSLLRTSLMGWPQRWAATSAEGGNSSYIRASSIAKLCDHEPLVHFDLKWSLGQSAFLTRLIDEVLPNMLSLTVVAPVTIRHWHPYLPDAMDEEEARQSAKNMVDSLNAPAPLLESLSVSFLYHFGPGFVNTAELPTSLFAGEAIRLRVCTLVNIFLPPLGCPALANIQTFHWRLEREELQKQDILCALSCLPQLKLLKLTALALCWDSTAHSPPLQRNVRNVHLDVQLVENMANFIADLGIERFVFDEKLLVPYDPILDELAASALGYVFTALSVGLHLFEAATRTLSTKRDLLVRCRPSHIGDYFYDLLPGMPVVSTLSALTTLSIHEFFWPPAEMQVAYVLLGIAVPAIRLPSLPVLRTIKVLLASCIDYKHELSEGVGVLHQLGLHIWDTPQLETLHLSYHLSQTCHSTKTFLPCLDPWRTSPSCCCKETLTVSLIDVHAFIERFVTTGHCNPRRLRRLIITGVEPIDLDQGASGMRLLNALADDVCFSLKSEPDNCHIDADVWRMDDLECIFRDKLPVSTSNG